MQFWEKLSRPRGRMKARTRLGANSPCRLCTDQLLPLQREVVSRHQLGKHVLLFLLTLFALSLLAGIFVIARMVLPHKLVGALIFLARCVGLKRLTVLGNLLADIDLCYILP